MLKKSRVIKCNYALLLNLWINQLQTMIFLHFLSINYLAIFCTSFKRTLHKRRNAHNMHQRKHKLQRRTILLHFLMVMRTYFYQILHRKYHLVQFIYTSLKYKTIIRVTIYAFIKMCFYTKFYNYIFKIV